MCFSAVSPEDENILCCIWLYANSGLDLTICAKIPLSDSTLDDIENLKQFAVKSEGMDIIQPRSDEGEPRLDDVPSSPDSLYDVCEEEIARKLQQAAEKSEQLEKEESTNNDSGNQSIDDNTEIVGGPTPEAEEEICETREPQEMNGEKEESEGCGSVTSEDSINVRTPIKPAEEDGQQHTAPESKLPVRILKKSNSVSVDGSDSTATSPSTQKPSVRFNLENTWRKYTDDLLGLDDNLKEEASQEPTSGSSKASAKGNSKSRPVIRDNIAARKRLHLAAVHKDGAAATSDDYVTPSQRKDHVIKDLKHQLKETQRVVETKDIELLNFNEQKEREIQEVLDEKDEQIKQLESAIEEYNKTCEKLTESYEEAVKTINSLEQTIKDMKVRLYSYLPQQLASINQ